MFDTKAYQNVYTVEYDAHIIYRSFTTKQTII